MPDLHGLIGDLRSEHAALEAMVVDLDDRAWETPTPAEGWAIRDQVGHVAFFDEQADLAVRDPERFTSELEQIAADVGAFMDRSVRKGREMPPPELLEWWRKARHDMLAAFEDVDPDRRIAWYGPPMKPASFISARIMETWAHAQDVADALGIEREATPNLRHIAHLAVLARRYSYEGRGLTVPDEPVFVELSGLDGERWTWGEPGANSVRGDAFEFCLVATQRRHPDDTDLDIEGEHAVQWMSIAQTYAGPPGSGRRPGQFPKRGAR